MTYKIIGDSCLDLTDELKKDARFQMVPLTLQVDDAQVIDDETFDQKSFLELVKNGKECPKTACPSPEKFKEAFECGAENIFVITLSSHLSGTYNAAVVGKELYEEEHGKDKNIAVVDSLSASSGELNIAMKIRDLCEQELPFDEVVKQAESYRDSMETFFVLESLDFLRKNGRLTGLQAFFATTLNIKPIMAGDKGVIVKLEADIHNAAQRPGHGVDGIDDNDAVAVQHGFAHQGFIGGVQDSAQIHDDVVGGGEEIIQQPHLPAVFPDHSPQIADSVGELDHQRLVDLAQPDFLGVIREIKHPADVIPLA